MRSLSFVTKRSGEGDINLTFRRTFREMEKREWDELISLLEGVNLSQCPDSGRWCLDKSGNFSTSSLYKPLTYPGMENKWMNSIWGAGLPMKIKMFLWQVCNDKIQSAEQLRKKIGLDQLNASSAAKMRELNISLCNACWQVSAGACSEMCYSGIWYLLA
jgi:hypothetical protein